MSTTVVHMSQTVVTLFQVRTGWYEDAGECVHTHTQKGGTLSASLSTALCDQSVLYVHRGQMALSCGTPASPSNRSLR